MECTTPEPGFNRTIKLLDIGDVERKISIAANDRERAFLAHKYDLVRIDKLSASVLLQRRSNGGGKIDVNGKLCADVVQKCVVSLLPVEKHVAENFSLVFEKGVVSGPGLDSFGRRGPTRILLRRLSRNWGPGRRIFITGVGPLSPASRRGLANTQTFK